MTRSPRSGRSPRRPSSQASTPYSSTANCSKTSLRREASLSNTGRIPKQRPALKRPSTVPSRNEKRPSKRALRIGLKPRRPLAAPGTHGSPVNVPRLEEEREDKKH